MRKHSTNSGREPERKAIQSLRLKGFKVKPTVNSGASNGDADFSLNNFQVEHKFTEKKSFTVSNDIWAKTCKSAKLKGRRPAIFIDVFDTTLVVISEKDFLYLLEGK